MEENILYLENHSDFIASCSQKYFGSLKKDQKNNINFKIDQDTAQKRINVLVDNIWESHSIYFSVIRTKAIKNCQYLGEHYLAQDWISSELSISAVRIIQLAHRISRFKRALRSLAGKSWPLILFFFYFCS